jgi:tRNA A37 N6-isopentenylltransferase MiaA
LRDFKVKTRQYAKQQQKFGRVNSVGRGKDFWLIDTNQSSSAVDEITELILSGKGKENKEFMET